MRHSPERQASAINVKPTGLPSSSGSGPPTHVVAIATSADGQRASAPRAIAAATSPLTADFSRRSVASMPKSSVLQAFAYVMKPPRNTCPLDGQAGGSNHSASWPVPPRQRIVPTDWRAERIPFKFAEKAVRTCWAQAPTPCALTSAPESPGRILSFRGAHSRDQIGRRAGR